jgi:hypothetical protein
VKAWDQLLHWMVVKIAYSLISQDPKMLQNEKLQKSRVNKTGQQGGQLKVYASDLL